MPASLDHVYVQVDGSGSHCLLATRTAPLTRQRLLGEAGATGSALTLLVSDFASATLRNDTIVSSGSGGDGIVVNPQVGTQTMTVDMTNTIARGASADLLVGAVAGATATVTADHSNFATVDNAGGGG